MWWSKNIEGAASHGLNGNNYTPIKAIRPSFVSQEWRLLFCIFNGTTNYIDARSKRLRHQFATFMNRVSRKALIRFRKQNIAYVKNPQEVCQHAVFFAESILRYLECLLTLRGLIEEFAHGDWVVGNGHKCHELLFMIRKAQIRGCFGKFYLNQKS